MCHSDDSRPPAPPNPGEVAEHGPLELTAEDGNRFTAYRAVPATPNGRNAVLLPDIRGLHPYYEALAQRFAEAGFHTVAMDYFGRTAGTGSRNDDFDWQAHVPKVTPESVRFDAKASVAAVRELQDGPTFTVGFCFGGAHSWRLAATDIGIAGAVGFYGRPAMVEEVAEYLHAPLLMLIAGADQATPLETFQAFDTRLTELGKDHEMYVYEGAPHSYFDRSFADWADACADSWRRILDFTARVG